MKKKILILLSYIILFINSNLLSQEKINSLKIGLLVPLSGEYSELGNSLLYSLQLALDEIDDKDVYLVPKDAGFKNKIKLNSAIQELRNQEIKVFIGPINHDEFEEAKKYKDSIFISPSNISPEFENNIISVGISL